MTEELKIELQEQVFNLNSLVKEGLHSLTLAGEFVVQLLKDFTAKEIAEESKFLTVRDVQDLKLIGERKISPELFCFKGPSTNYIAKLPLAAQTEVLENGVDVLVPVEGKLTRTTIPANKLKREHCRVVFYGDKINSITAQKKILQQGVATKVRKPESFISGGRLYVTRATSFSKSDLKEFLNQL